MYFDLIPDRAPIVSLRSSAKMAFHFPNDEWMKAFDKELGLERFNEDMRKRREYHNILLFADKVLLSAIQKSTVEQLGRLLAYPFANFVYGARALDIVPPKGERDSPSFRLALAGDILLKDLLRRDSSQSATDNCQYPLTISILAHSCSSRD